MMHITKLVLTNYRCFPSLSVDFSERLTVLVALNGNGKTAVLDALAIALGPFVGAFDDGKDRRFSSNDIRCLPYINSLETYRNLFCGLSIESCYPF